MDKFIEVDRKVKEVDWAKPGTKAGLEMLESFCQQRLKYFAADRNNPTKNALSNLSPWFHAGNEYDRHPACGVQKGSVWRSPLHALLAYHTGSFTFHFRIYLARCTRLLSPVK